MNESTLNSFATKIALHCQKAARGIKARDQAQIKRWEKANVAAYRIQKAFRTWKMLQFTRKRYKRVTKKKLDKSSGNWEKVLSNQGTHAEKMIIWRNVIELRRGFPEYTSEMCLKALITTNGDLTKAVPLLGSLDFAYQAQYGPPIAEDIKESINPYTKTYLSEESMEKMMMRNSRDLASGSQRRAHRYLHESLNTKSAMEMISPAYDLENIILQSYYSTTCVQIPASKKGKIKPPKKK